MKIWWGGSVVLRDGGEGWSEGWLQREDEGRENTLCPYFWVPVGIHSSWSFLFRCCLCRSASLSLLFRSLSLSQPSSFFMYISIWMCACDQDKYVYFLFISLPPRELPQASPFCHPRKTRLLLNHPTSPCFTPTFLLWAHQSSFLTILLLCVKMCLLVRPSPLFQMVTTTLQACPGCPLRPLARTWRRPLRCPMAAATSAWPPGARRREAPGCRTPASSVTNPSGISSTFHHIWML